MKKHKRDPSQQAFSRGYKAGISGRSRDLCTTQLINLRAAWLNGWREGRSDQWEGMTGVSGIHKNPTVHTTMASA
ncbi:ribosome modulation factor [Carnimonas nigrificans]|uniref:ribosome modulation factor n=1 Tax=Carnimonas nigrificans TaxID=64323 RepID=UPI00046F84A1|nr:ribosome modulation factor [Carnimonas nigrificans]